MEKVLVITSVASMVDQFLISNIRLLQDMNYEVHVACNFEKGNTCSMERIAELKQELAAWNITYYQIDFARNVANLPDNYRAYKQVTQLISGNHYKIIHCHSPIGGFLTRIAGRKARRSGTKIFYTAHGFHFYKGAPLINWLLYYPIEKLCAHFTDVLITINREDYALAKKKLNVKQIEYVPGVGIDLERFRSTVVDRSAKRRELGIPEDAVLLLSVGELNKNKNHETVIRAIAEMDVYYIIAGKGRLENYLQSLIDELSMTDRVKLLGFRRDVAELYKTADQFVFASFREGLPVSVMEAMASGMPVVCSRIRGNKDLISEDAGWLFDPRSVDACRTSIRAALKEDREKTGAHNMQLAQNYGLNTVCRIMKALYCREL